MSEKNTLHLAITMAGAVSAGAYTAGVMDYLLEVLEKWEKLKKAGDPLAPKYNIKIEILSGASAGGMTAAITSLALHQDKKQSICAFSSDPATAYGDCANPVELENRKKNNRFFDSWVNLTKPDMIAEMLKTDDETNIIFKNDKGEFVKGGIKSCISALNSNFVSELAENILSVRETDLPLALPPYVSDKLRLFVTLTNLDGYEKSQTFAGGGDFNPSFLMYDHRDVAFFRFTPLNGQENDGSLQVNLKDKDHPNTRLFILAGVATGAFPIGLAYRTFSRGIPDMQKNMLLNMLHEDMSGINFPLTKDEYRATFMDGGIINNEPFDLTERLLWKNNQELNFSPDHNELNCVTLMIDPFPSEPRAATDYGDDLELAPYNLLATITKLLSILRTQVLVKTGLIKRALDKRDFSCFIMAPRRKIFNGMEIKPVDGTKAIACGTLGGFSGFLNKGFREHDFYLGRINCKSFLQNHFCVPADTENEIFKNGYSPECREKFKIIDKNKKEFLPIIPDVNMLEPGNNDLNDLYRRLAFPRLTAEGFKKDFSRHKSAIIKRIKFVIKTNTNAFGWFLGALLWWFGDKIFNTVHRSVEKALKAWEIIKE